MSGDSFRRAYRGLGATLLMQLWLVGLAGLHAAVLGPALDASPVAITDLRGLAELFALQPGLLRVLGTSTVAALVTHLLALPALQLAWLYALAHGQPTGASLRFGITHYGAAWRQSLIVVGVGLAGAAALCAVPVYVWDEVASEAERTRRAALTASFLPLLGWLLWCSLWHDLARAHLATHGALRLRTLLGQWTESARPSRWFPFGLQALLAIPLLCGAQVVHLHRPGLAGLAIAQALLLARGLVRSVWLARATVFAEQRQTLRIAERERGS